MTRRRRSRKRGDKALLDRIYRATVVFALATAFHGERHPVSQRTRKQWDEALRNAEAAGVPEQMVKSRVQLGGQEADKIRTFLDKFPNMVLVLELGEHGPGWKISGGSEA